MTRPSVGDSVNKPLPGDARDFLDKPYMRAHDLQGKAHNVRILKVGWVKSFDKKSNQMVDRVAIYFVSKQNGTPTKYLEMKSDLIIDQLATTKDGGAALGYDHSKWVGQVICIYPNKEKHGANTWEVIRIKKMNPDLPEAQAMPGINRPTPTPPGVINSKKEGD